MMNDGGGNVAARPAGPAGAQTQIGVFTIKEKRIVETAGLGEHCLAIDGSGAAGEQHFAGLGEILRRLAVAALLAGSIGGD